MMARPRGEDWLEDEIKGLSYRGINCIVSLLDRSEARELGLAEEADLCRKYGMEFISYPIEDLSVPTDERTLMKLLDGLMVRLHEQKKVLIHCRAGIGRSSVVASCLLIALGIDGEQVFDLLSQAREVEVPDTDEQKYWVLDFAEKMHLAGKV